jgi:hypothetical protein
MKLGTRQRFALLTIQGVRAIICKRLHEERISAQIVKL